MPALSSRCRTLRLMSDGYRWVLLNPPQPCPHRAPTHPSHPFICAEHAGPAATRSLTGPTRTTVLCQECLLWTRRRPLPTQYSPRRWPPARAAAPSPPLVAPRGGAQPGSEVGKNARR
eukprot:scaffold926_cov408-Prasinococcus_capsulatus_cf.AAC.9